MRSLEHSLIALVLVLVCSLAGHPYRGVALAAGFLFGREHAQAEYRWIEHYGNHLRANMPWWGGFDRRAWDTHSWLWNLVMPVAVAIVTALLFSHFYLT